VAFAHHYTHNTTLDDQKTKTNEHHTSAQSSYTLNHTPTPASQTISTIDLRRNSIDSDTPQNARRKHVCPATHGIIIKHAQIVTRAREEVQVPVL
jgi:hypothetical protein